MWVNGTSFSLRVAKCCIADTESCILQTQGVLLCAELGFEVTGMLTWEAEEWSACNVWNFGYCWFKRVSRSYCPKNHSKINVLLLCSKVWLVKSLNYILLGNSLAYEVKPVYVTAVTVHVDETSTINTLTSYEN